MLLDKAQLVGHSRVSERYSCLYKVLVVKSYRQSSMPGGESRQHSKEHLRLPWIVQVQSFSNSEVAPLAFRTAALGAENHACHFPRLELCTHGRRNPHCGLGPWPDALLYPRLRQPHAGHRSQTTQEDLCWPHSAWDNRLGHPIPTNFTCISLL